jgi:uncharacterized protein YlxW (UPF0749 family)
MGLFLTPQGSPTTRPATAPQRAEPASPSESSPEHSTEPNNDRRSWWASLFVLCAVLGAMLGLSFKTQDTITRFDLPTQNFGALAELTRGLRQQVDGLTRDNKGLKQRLDKYQNGAGAASVLAQNLAYDLAQAKFLAGLTPVAGPGLVVTLNDSKKGDPNAPAIIQNSFLIHDTDINQVINELRAAGAEALSINDQRIVAMSPVRCAGPTVLVNFVPLTPPYVIRAIGDSKTLMDAMNLEGGVADNLRKQDPDMVALEPAKKLHLPVYSGPSQPKYAKPERQAANAPDNASAAPDNIRTANGPDEISTKD